MHLAETRTPAITWILTYQNFNFQYLHSAEVYIFVHELIEMQEYSVCVISIIRLQQSQLSHLLSVQQLQQFLAFSLSEMSDSSEKGSTSVQLVTLHSPLSHATSHIDALVQVVWCELQGRADYLQSIITG